MDTLITGIKPDLTLTHEAEFREIKRQYIGKPMRLRIDSPKRRSTDQNSYYWGVVLKLLADHTGYNVDEMHEICKYNFLGIDNKELAGENIPIINSTRTLSTSDFMGYIEEIKQWATTLGVVIPDPNEQDYRQGQEYKPPEDL